MASCKGTTARQAVRAHRYIQQPLAPVWLCKLPVYIILRFNVCTLRADCPNVRCILTSTLTTSQLPLVLVPVASSARPTTALTVTGAHRTCEQPTTCAVLHSLSHYRHRRYTVILPGRHQLPAMVCFVGAECCIISVASLT